MLKCETDFGRFIEPTINRSSTKDDDGNDINLRLGGASETDIPRPPGGYRDMLS
jgi:hypothetical protein